MGCRGFIAKFTGLQGWALAALLSSSLLPQSSCSPACAIGQGTTHRVATRIIHLAVNHDLFAPSEKKNLIFLLHAQK